MRDYFCGWYFKCQSDEHTIAIIPAFHKSKEKCSCSIQIITDEGAWNADFPYEKLTIQKGGFGIVIENNRFGEKGIELNINKAGLVAKGILNFGKFSPIQYDIMGPFRYVPFMECRHSVLSMRHTVSGELIINGLSCRFENALGYIEGDRGCSFPKEYAWTQCFLENGSIMLSVADIPLGPLNFTGVIGVIYIDGREYRIATYLGAKAVRIRNGEVVIRQGKYVLSVRLIEKHPHPLRAPIGGEMNRTIHESAVCRVLYRFKEEHKTLFSVETEKASMEYEYQH